MADADFSDLSGLIDEALSRARAGGLDRISAIRRAAQAVRAVRPDLTPDEAYSLVELSNPVWRRSHAA